MPQGRNKNVAQPKLEQMPLAYRANTLPLSYLVTWSTLTFSPCLIRFVPELLETMHEPTSPCAARSPSTDAHGAIKYHTNVVRRPGLDPRVSRLPCEHSIAELRSHFVDRIHMYMLAFPLFFKNLALNKHKWDSLKRIQ